MRHAFFVLLVSILSGEFAHAGFVEVGASGTYRKSNIAEDAYNESLAYTGSLAYYFNEASALELSYTEGRNKQAINEGAVNGHITLLKYQSAGLDFVFTFGPKDAFLRPYLKAGAQYIISKKIIDQYRGPDGELMTPTVYEDDPGLVPSAGAGLKLGLTEALSLKVGVDMWTSRPMNKPPVTMDVFGRAGLSWFF